MESEKQTRLRRSKLEGELKVNLFNISNFSFDPREIVGQNCENLIGATQVPLGIAGPILVKGSKLKVKSCWLPLATTEGALVASVNRGCKATRLSGGINVFVKNIGTTRGPVFRVKNLSQAFDFVSFVEKNFEKMAKIAQGKEKHLKLLKIDSQIVGRNVFLRFFHDTKEAMGMNMVTIGTQKIVEFLEKKTKVKCVSLSGNFCVDKKPSFLNFLTGRGKSVWAESVIKKKIVEKVLKTTPEKIVEVSYRKNLLGSAVSGSLAFNAHYANIVAALFLATGQDIAHVVEGSQGITTAELEKNGDLYFSVFLPCLMVGVIGGGTQLPTQKEALSILGLDKVKSGDALKFAEIVGGAVLAGELSLVAALSAGHLTEAHERLGRGVKQSVKRKA